MTSRKKAPSRPCKAPPRRPWERVVGFPCSFYHEGGRGQNYWARGWRYGHIIETPIKGQHKGWMRVEVRVPLYGWNDDKTKGKIGYYQREFERAWVSQWNINEPGDFMYHGPKLEEIVQARTNEKASQVREALKNPRASRSKADAATVSRSNGVDNVGGGRKGRANTVKKARRDKTQGKQ